MPTNRGSMLNRLLGKPAEVRKPVDHSVDGIYDIPLRDREFEPNITTLSAPVALADLDPAGASAGDVVTLVGGTWTHQAPAGGGPSATTLAEANAGTVTDEYIPPSVYSQAGKVFFVGTGFRYTTVSAARTALGLGTTLVIVGTVTDDVDISSTYFNIVIPFGSTWNFATGMSNRTLGQYLHIDVYGTLNMGSGFGAQARLANGANVVIDGHGVGVLYPQGFGQVSGTSTLTLNNFPAIDYQGNMDVAGINLKLQNSNWNCPLGGSINLYNCTLVGSSVKGISYLQSGSQIFRHSRFYLPASAGNDGIVVNVLSTSSVHVFDHCLIENPATGTNNVGVLFQVNSVGAGTRYYHTSIWTSGSTGYAMNATSGALANFPAYGCIFRRGVNNITFEAGNASNFSV